jgi:hypothetical protein
MVYQIPRGNRGRSDRHHHAPVDLVFPHSVENVVHVLQTRGGVVNLHLPIPGKLKAFSQIQPRADDRPPDGLAGQDGVEDVEFE